MLSSYTIKNLTKDIRFVFFSLALILYAIWGSPTPNQPGFIELVIGVLLILSLTMTGAFQNLISQLMHKTDKWFLSIIILSLYGLTLPLVFSVLKGAPLQIVLRDLVAFLFLCAPLFFYSFICLNQARQNLFYFLLLFIGLIFSLRVLIPQLPIFNTTTELLYLANSPLVLFASLFFISRSAQCLFDSLTLRHILFFLAGSSLFLITLLAMLVDTQRATIAALIASAMFLSIIALIKAPVRAMLPVLIFSAALFMLYPAIAVIIENIGLKTAAVGLNMRLQELQAVWDAISPSWVSVAFGQGWGSSFASPAVGELHVTFSHSLLTYVLFKMGVVGLFLTLIYLFFIFEKLLRLYFINPVKGNAMLWPLLIPILLYASHKSFDFGLLLTLILVTANKARDPLKVTV